MVNQMNFLLSKQEKPLQNYVRWFSKMQLLHKFVFCQKLLLKKYWDWLCNSLFQIITDLSWHFDIITLLYKLL